MAQPGLLLDRLGAGRADQEIVFEADIIDDRLVHGVAGGAHRARIDHAAHRQHGDIGGAAADVDDHRAARLRDRKAGADRRRDRLLDQIDPPRAGRQAGFMHGAALDRRGARRHADHDARTGEQPALEHAADEMLDHLLRGGEVGDHAVAQRLDGFDLARACGRASSWPRGRRR